jgi:hypothetical protein
MTDPSYDDLLVQIKENQLPTGKRFDEYKIRAEVTCSKLEKDLGGLRLWPAQAVGDLLSARFAEDGFFNFSLKPAIEDPIPLDEDLLVSKKLGADPQAFNVAVTIGPGERIMIYYQLCPATHRHMV